MLKGCDGNDWNFHCCFYCRSLDLSIFFLDYDKCYSEREADGYAIFGCCGGMVGGTKQTNYLSEICVGCPYLVLSEEKKHD